MSRPRYRRGLGYRPAAEQVLFIVTGTLLAVAIALAILIVMLGGHRG